MPGSMRTYHVVILDMFDTLVKWNNHHLPLVKVNGQEFRSSSPFVYEVLKPLCPHLSLDDFAQAFLQSYRSAEEVRKDEDREITARDRFRMLFRRLGIAESLEADRLLETGLAEHQRRIMRCMEFPDSHRATLETLASRYRLAVLSNFDHAPTIERVLAAYGIRDRFEAVIVSGDVGWRKPRPEIFAEAFRQLRVGPAEAILVGDTPEGDVLGAQGVGMDVIWIDDGSKPLPPGAPSPTYTVRSLPEITHLL
jgi:HAD superfamily hydrolase (TIGR01549 family)